MKHSLLTALLAGLLATPALAQPTVSLLAGGVPYADGPAGTGHTQEISGLYLNAAGNLLFTDTYQVRQVSPAGVLSTVAGLPRSGGTTGSPAGTLGRISALTGDAAGNLYFLSQPRLGGSTIQKLTPTGQLSLAVASAGISSIISFVRDASGNFYTTEGTGGWRIRRITPGGSSTVLAGGTGGHKDGPPGVGRLYAPQGLVLNTDGNFYFGDDTVIRQLNPSTGYLRTIAGDTTSNGYADGQGTQAHFGANCTLALAPGGNLYVADAYNNCLRLVTPAGTVTTVAGSATAGYADGTGAAARFTFPGPLLSTASGDVLVAENGPNRIRRVTPAGVVSTYLPAAGTLAAVDGPSSTARFISPSHLSVGAGGNLLLLESRYFGDPDVNFYAGGRLRQVSPAGVVTTLFTLNEQSGYLDGPIATARFGQEMFGAAQDAAGNIYLADLSNRCIRKITPAGVVSTLAGNAGSQDFYVDGTGTQARFIAPYGLTIDGAGNLYMFDIVALNLRKITPAGVVTTVAGSMGGAQHNPLPLVDGQGGAAHLGQVWGLAATTDGTVYLAAGNTVRRVSATGLVSTIAGDYATNASGQVDGVGPAARFSLQYGIPLAVAPGGVVFVGEWNTDFNSVREARTRIRRIAPNGTVSTVLASNETGYVDGPATTAVLGNIRSLAFTPAGNLVLSDITNHCLRQLSGAALLAAPPATALAGTLRAYPNPTAGGSFSAELPASAAGQPTTLTLYDALGRAAWQHAYASAPATAPVVPTASLPAGLYRLRCTSPAGTSSCAVQVQ